VMGRPTHNGVEQYTLESKGAVRVVTDGIAQQVGVTSGIGEVIPAVVLMHPRSLEETVRILGNERLTVLVEYLHGTGSLSKLQHVVCHAGHTGLKSLLTTTRQLLATHLQTVVLIPLQLSAPDATEVTVHLAIVILEDAGVDAVRATDGVWLWDKGAFGLFGNGNAEAEQSVVIFGRKDEIIATAFLSPGYLFDTEDYAMVGGGIPLYVIKRQDMVVLHLEVTAIVVEALTAVPVVARIDI